MRLRIENFAKIRTADVQVRGLTVICGLNNTGKSTVGKVLHSIFNSLRGIERKVGQQRIEIVRGAVRDELDSMHAGLPEPVYWACSQHLHLYLRGAHPATHEDLLSRINEWMTRRGIDPVQERELAGRLADKVWDVLRIPVENVHKIIVSGYFMRMFGDQMVSIYDSSRKASVALEVRGETIGMGFDARGCVSLANPGVVKHRSIYIDNPYILDRVSSSRSNWRTERPTEEELFNLLQNYKRDIYRAGNAYRRTLVADKLKEVEQRLSRMVQGRVVSGSDGLALQHDRGGMPLSLRNLSLGLKSFMVLYMLLESLRLEEQDVLVLDEPEIHLHTEWQVAYAEIIVLLQKCFNLSVVVTTHSPFFLDALVQYTRKHGTHGNTDFYLSRAEDDYAVIENVNGELHKIYDVIAPSLALLKRLRYDNDNPGEEQ
ncbi:MAG: AAA family ATPase [Akkermansia sp.]|nr:AAA family ATPase [Akkermansia sp.]